MNSQNNFEYVKNRFYFDYINHEPDLEKEANMKLIQLLAYAPPGATGVGLVEKNGQGFLSSVIIKSPFRKFTSNALGTNPKDAVRRALERLEDELYRWRFGGGSGHYGRLTRATTGAHLPWARSS